MLNRIATRMTGSLDIGLMPWQVAIREYKTKVQFCSGAILNERMILTAGHCRKHREGRFFLITTGHRSRPYEIAKNEYYFQEKRAKEIILHPRFSLDLHMDMAIIHLDDPLILNEQTQPACLPPRDLTLQNKDSVYCFMSGWGNIDNERTFSSSPNTLRGAVLKYFGPKECNKLWKTNQPNVGRDPVALDGTQVCFGFKRGKIDICDNDSGGPLMCLVNEKWSIFGIASYGWLEGCGKPNHPSSFSRVSHPGFYDWILQEMQ